MRVRSFHAPSAKEALLRARTEMGDDARILTTRATPRGVELVVAEGARAPRESELRALRLEVEELRARLHSAPVPPHLTSLDRRLTAAGLPAAFRARVLAAATPHTGLTAHEAAFQALALGVPILPPKGPRSRGPRIVALVGPTGVGKTTTIAKLAGRLTAARKRVALLTFDTYRVGAAEQLHAYAQLLAAPCETILTPDAAAEAASRHRDCDVVLLDTTGRGPNDSERLARLAEALQGIDGLEVLLVCAANHSEEALRDAARRFEATRPTGMVATKLDETRQVGPVFAVASEVNLPVAFLCAGQEVPADIERASGAAVARWILRAGAAADEAAA